MDSVFDFNSYFNKGLYTPELNETVGTIQVGHPDIYEFVKSTTNDLLFQHYKEHLLSNEDLETRQMYFPIKSAFGKENNIYIMKYEPSISWIDNIDIIVIETKDPVEETPTVLLDVISALGLDETTEPDFRAAAFTREPNITKLTHSSFSHCAILFNNPQVQEKKDILGDIFHELNHYYMMFKIYYNTTQSFMDDSFYNLHYPEYKFYYKRMEDMRNDNNGNKLLINLSALYIDNNVKVIEEHFNSIVSNPDVFCADVKRVFTYCCYMLNDIEINGHKENIFTDLVCYYKNHGKKLPLSINDETFLKENITLCIYKRIYYVLKYIHGLVNNDIRKVFQVKHSLAFGEVFGYNVNNQEEIDKLQRTAEDELNIFLEQENLKNNGKKVKGHKQVMSIDRCFTYLCNKCENIFVNDIRRMIGYLPYVDLSIY